MKSGKSVQKGPWIRVSENLVRYLPSGTYYARVRTNGKLDQKSLKTDRPSVARLRLQDFVKERRERSNSRKALLSGKMTFGNAADQYRAQLTDRRDIKESSKVYCRENLEALLHTWVGLADLHVEKIDESACQEWATKYLKHYSATRFNGTLSVLRDIFAIAVKAGARYGNPALLVKRAKVKPKEMNLPSRKKFMELVRTIESARGRFSKDCADFVQFLAFTGCRKNEAKNVTWRDVEFEKGTILVRGDEITGTKSGDSRRVYLFPELKALLQRMKTDAPQAKPTDKVLRVSEAQKAIDRAAKIVGTDRITHHDLRHLYATTLIENGIDPPTVARMLGHKDGGALAMKTYGHLRDDHARASVGKVQFI